jgi:putative sigma-54 modulation protein
MRLQVKGRGIEVSESVRRYAEGKFQRLERQLDDPRIELELHVERNESIADDHTAEATIYTKGRTLRAHAAARAFEATIDDLVDKLERQVVRYRERRHRKPAHKTPAKVEGAAAPAPSELLDL